MPQITNRSLSKPVNTESIFSPFFLTGSGLHHVLKALKTLFVTMLLFKRALKISN